MQRRLEPTGRTRPALRGLLGAALSVVALTFGVQAQTPEDGGAAPTPATVLAELRAAAAGGAQLDGARLSSFYRILAGWEAATPDDDAVPGVPWSEPLALLDAEIEKHADLRTLNVYSARVLGERLDREGRRTEAIAHLERAWRRLRDDPYAVYLRITLGEILRDVHRFAEAMTELRAARDRIAELRETRGRELHGPTLDFLRTMATIELGAAAEQLGMVDVAEPMLREAEQLALELADGTGPATWGSALVYELNLALDHRPENGVELRRRFEKNPWRELVSPETAAQIALRLAAIDVRLAFLGEAPPGSGADELRALLGVLKPNEELSCRMILAVSHLDRGEHALALEEIETVRDRLADAGDREPLRLKLLASGARHLRTLPAPADERARFLADELRPGMDVALARILEWPIEPSGVAPLGLEPMLAAFGELIRYELDVAAGGGGAERALAWLLRLQAVGTFARREGIGAPPAGELRRALAADGALVLAWLPGRETTHLFAIDATSVDVYDLPGVWSLQRSARRLSEDVLAAVHVPDGRNDARLAASADAASRAFLPDELGPRLSSARAIRATGLEAFGYVPLEALPAPSLRGDAWTGGDLERWERVLGRSHAIAYLPSLPVGVWLDARAATSPSGSALAAAGFVAHGRRETFTPLAVEAADIGIGAYDARAVAARGLDELLGALGDARLAHLFCHGTYDESRVLPAGLVLEPEAPDGVWFAEDVERRAWPAVVLVSACRSARAPLRRGDDGAGMLRSAFYRGGAVVAASATMPLEELAAAELGRLVHAELARGATVGEAFLAARRGARPAELGGHPVHSYLWHVVGVDDVRVVDPARASARGAASRRWRAPQIALGVAGLVAILARAAALNRRRRGSRSAAR